MGQIKPKELSKLGYTLDTTRSLVIGIVSKYFKHETNAEIAQILVNIKQDPQQYMQDEVLHKIAKTFLPAQAAQAFEAYTLREELAPCTIYGAKHIEVGAKRQMDTALALPVTVQGALMPDTHTGYGLPIGGVLATNNAVIPYAVGVDIGCRMALSIMEVGEGFLKANRYQLKKALQDYTHFGTEGFLDIEQEHSILDDERFKATPILKQLYGKAVKQLGSSGSGNHFVEFGMVELEENDFGLHQGSYLALLSHSGSRGLGANIAMHYTKVAMEQCRLPQEAKSLAWLDMETAAGQEYWLSMQLAGDYAKACHDAIHHNVLKALGLKKWVTIENHHNFAWKENLNGKSVIVHRKGATPAAEGELGIIPGSMLTPAYIVAGKGSEDALRSASHGAGRAMSRKKAGETITVSEMKKKLANAGVILIGGSVEENASAYKDIDLVMQAQQELVGIVGKFYPRIVRMNKD